MKARTVAATLLVALALVGAACSNNSNDTVGDTTGTTAAGSPAAAGTAVVHVTLKDMSIALDKTTVPAGKVTFEITNQGPSTHAFDVLMTDLAPDKLPVGADGTVDESAAGIMRSGGIPSIPAGGSKNLALTLGPGSYVGICNLAGHYAAGMYTGFSVTPSAASSGASTVDVKLKDMSITLDTSSVPAGNVTFDVTNEGPSLHEFVVLKTNYPLGKIPLDPKENDRVYEDGHGVTHMGETGNVKVGASKSVTIDLAAGTYQVVCNLPGHYQAGMYALLTVTPAVTTAATGPTAINATLKDMSITMDRSTVPEGKVEFNVRNDGPSLHEFVVLKTDYAPGQIPQDPKQQGRVYEDGHGVQHIGETGDLPPGKSDSITLTLAPGKYQVICNLPGHYQAGMYAELTVTPAPASTVTVTLKDMSVGMSTTTVPAGKVTFNVTNEGPSLHEMVVLKTDYALGKIPLDPKENDRVYEDGHGVTHAGEVGNVKVGASKSVTLNLKPGTYQVVCNLPGHYQAGMYAPLTVT